MSNIEEIKTDLQTDEAKAKQIALDAVNAGKQEVKKFPLWAEIVAVLIVIGVILVAIKACHG